MSNHKIVGYGGDPCPRCGCSTEIREHVLIRKKHLRQPFYYTQWFYCTNADCITTLIMPPQFRIFRSDRLRKKWARIDARRHKQYRSAETREMHIESGPVVDIVMDVLNQPKTEDSAEQRQEAWNKLDEWEIPEFLKISAERRKEAWREYDILHGKKSPNEDNSRAENITASDAAFYAQQRRWHELAD